MDDDWKWTGVCPSCGKRAITGGRCISCDWYSKDRIERDHFFAIIMDIDFNKQKEIERAVQCII
jgi:hypothetical protein